jgi:hypothetical protein
MNIMGACSDTANQEAEKHLNTLIYRLCDAGLICSIINAMSHFKVEVRYIQIPQYSNIPIFICSDIERVAHNLGISPFTVPERAVTVTHGCAVSLLKFVVSSFLPSFSRSFLFTSLPS